MEKWTLAIVGHVGTQPDLLEALRREWPRLQASTEGGDGGPLEGHWPRNLGLGGSEMDTKACGELKSPTQGSHSLPGLKS